MLTKGINQEMSQSNNIYPKTCGYGCGLQIYWNTSVNEYWEVLTQKKHVCPNRITTNKPTTMSTTSNTTSTYYNKKPWSPKPKEKMSNSFELLSGPISQVQRQYEVLSDIVIGLNGKVHGSQRDRDSRTGLLDLLVYYEVPEGKRDEVKRRFEFIKTKSATIINP